MTVIIRLRLAFFELLWRISWWDHVMETPDDNKMIVFKRGIFIGLKELIIIGGQNCPNSMLGLTLLWKYDQKNDAKNNTSDEMNRIIPIFIPLITLIWWNPCLLVSLITSFHHKYEMHVVIVIDIRKGSIIFILFQIVADDNIDMIEKDAIRGHGLISTMWNWWNLLNIIDFCWV